MKLNAFVNHFRSFSKHLVVSVSAGLDGCILHINQATSRHFVDAEFGSDAANKAMRTLDPIYAIPFLKYFEGYRYHEIAKELNISVETVKSHIRIAREELKSDLKSNSRSISA